MFLVRGINGPPRPYEVGEFRKRRKTEPPEAVSQLSSKLDSHAGNETQLPHTAHLLQRYHNGENQKGHYKELLNARDIMSTPVFTVSASTSMKEVQKIFAAHRFRHLPVLSDHQQLVGLISDRDILRFQINLHETVQSEFKDAYVSQFMTPHVLTAHPHATIRTIARTLFEERIGSMPIVDDSDTVQGIITRSDILRALINHGPIQLWA